MPGYLRARPAGTWKRKNEGQPYTPVRKIDLEKWDQAIFDLKYLSRDIRDYADTSVLTSNCETVVNQALSDANADGGGDVLLPTGIGYVTTGQITIQPKTFLRGQGSYPNDIDLTTTKGTTTITSSYNGSVLRFPSGHGAGVEDLMVYGDTSQASQVLLDIGDAGGAVATSKFGIKRVHLKKSGLDCLQLRGVLLESHFEELYAHGAERYNLFANGNEINAIKYLRCDFREAKQFGIRILGGSHHFDTCVIESNSLHSSVAYGGLIMHSSGNGIIVVLEGCHFENNDGFDGNGVPFYMDTSNPTPDLHTAIDIGSHYAETGAPCRIDDGRYIGIGVTTTLPTHAEIGAGAQGAEFIGCQRVDTSPFKVTGSLRGVASAATITLPDVGEVFTVSGTTQINTITSSYAGRRVTLVFEGVVTVGDIVGNLNIGGAFTSTANDTLSLICDGVNWLEVARSIN